MKKAKLIVFLSILGSQLAAQNISTFNKIYPVIPGMYCYSDRINVCAGGYMIYGGTIDSNNLSRVVMLKIDTLGNLLWKKSYGKSGYNFYDESIIVGGGGVSVPWGGYIEPGSISNSRASWYKLALYRFDDNGDTIWTKIYNDSTNELGITVKVTRQKQYIVGEEWALYDTISGFRFFTTTLKKTDTLGNTIWQKTYHGLPGHNRESLSLDTCEDGGYIISALDNDTNYECGWSIFIMKTDSGGLPQWTQYIHNPVCGVFPGNTLSLRDGSYLICGTYDDSSKFNGGQQYSKVYMVKLSNSGIILWQKQYGIGGWLADGLQAIKELPDGDIIACGEDSSILGCILKVDSNGNQKWLRYYEMQSPAEQDYLLDIQPTLDGGYVSAGATYPGVGGSTQNIWVVKTDSLGCDTVGCNYATGVGEVKGHPDSYRDEEVNVYPNPANSSLTIAYSLNNSAQEVNLMMYDILGNKVADWTLPSGASANTIVSENISSLAPGMYFYTIFEDNKVVQRNKLVIER